MTMPMRTTTLVLLAVTTALSGCAMRPGRHGRLPSPVAVAPQPQAASPRDLISRLNGGLIGQGIANQLEPSERKLALEAEYRALEQAPGGQAITWQSPDRAVSGEVVAAPPYQVGSQNCRQYTHKVTINGAVQQARGAACRNSDGSWTPLS